MKTAQIVANPNTNILPATNGLETTLVTGAQAGDTLLGLTQGVESTTLFRQIMDITFSESELRQIDERWRIFGALSRGLSQRQVAAETGASIATVTRGAKVYRENKAVIDALLAKIQP